MGDARKAKTFVVDNTIINTFARFRDELSRLKIRWKYLRFNETLCEFRKGVKDEPYIQK